MECNELVKQAQAGDKEAFREVCSRFTGLVKKYAYQSHMRLIAEEAEAQGWLAVVQAVQSYDESCGVHFPGYVDSCVKYATWNLFKKERRRWQEEGQLEGEEGADVLASMLDKTDVAGDVEGRWLSQELMVVVALLPDKQRQVIVETVVGKVKLTDIAAELGITPQAVYNLRQRGLARLKTLCAGMYLDERG